MNASLLVLVLLTASTPASAPASQSTMDFATLRTWTRSANETLARIFHPPEKTAQSPAVLQVSNPPSLATVSPVGTFTNLGIGAGAALLVGLVPLALALLTSYIRISVVLALLRTGLAAPGVPPVSVQTGLAILLTGVVMTPTVEQVWTGSIQPVLSGQADIKAVAPRSLEPVRAFMTRQVDATGQHDKVRLFIDRAHLPAPKSWADVPTSALVPGYCLAELHTAFQIGVRLLVPFLVLDLVVAAVLVSLGLFLVPPTLVSLPLKLLLFVAADGWTLVVGSLLKGFGE